QYVSRSRIDPSQLALVAFPGAVPELSIDPGDSGDEAVGLDRAKNRPGLGIPLMDLSVAVLSDPQRPLGPREPRIAAAAGRGNRGEHASGLRIDLLDAIFDELIQVRAVERRSRVPRDIEGAHRRPARGIERLDRMSGCEPDVSAVVRHSMHVVHTREGPVLADDLGRRS